jgi:hypothetical protein
VVGLSDNGKIDPVLARLDQLQTISGFVAIVFVVKSLVFIVAL